MFKVYLAEEQWARVCAFDDEIASEVAKQQPEMYSRFAPPKHADGGESPVADKTAPEALQQIENMRSKDKLQLIIANDRRVTVQEAASKRLAAVKGG